MPTASVLDSMPAEISMSGISWEKMEASTKATLPLSDFVFDVAKAVIEASS